MSIVNINKREAYTQNELINLITEKMKREKTTYGDIFRIYNNFFESEDEVKKLLNKEIYFNYDIYKFIEKILDIPINKLLEIVEDDDDISARGDISGEDEKEFLDLINYLFDRMIYHERINSNEKKYSNLLLKGTGYIKQTNDIDRCIKIFKALFKNQIKEDKESMNLLESFQEKQGFYILRFPNNLGISGATIAKNTINDDYKYICIYINTKEPIGRQKFTLAHELYHIMFQKSEYNLSYIKDRKSIQIEKLAEEFASKLIIPRSQLVKEILKLKKQSFQEFTLQELIDLQKYFKVSFQSIMYSIDNDIKVNEKYSKYQSYIPIIKDKYKKYYKGESNWEELARITEKYTNLNCIDDRFIFPKRFQLNLNKSLSENMITKDEFEYINNFFDN